MQESNNLLQGLGIPHSALLSVICGVMLLSFPIGMFVVFNSDIGGDINFDYPLFELDSFKGLKLETVDLTIGDAFTILWSTYVILFAIALFGPKNNFLQTISPIIFRGSAISDSNYLVSTIKWFSILVLISAIIAFTQEGFGIKIIPPSVDNNLEQFFLVTLSPLVEEIGFRALLLGIPLYVIYSHKTSLKYFLKSLWYPSENLHVYDSKKAIILIVIVGILFGFAHISMGEPWSEGKFAQAAASGIILGWVYFRFGLLSAILVHWGTNSFIFSFANFTSQINEISLDDAFNHSLMNSLEILFLISGIISVAVLVTNYYYSKNKHRLEI